MRPISYLLSRGFVGLALLILMLVSAGCGSATTSSGQTTGSGTPSAQASATATLKPAPTVAPLVTQPFCLSALTVDEANQIMSPSTPATTLQIQSTAGEQGVCRYTSAGAQFPVLTVVIDYKLYTGPKPVPDATIQQLVAQLTGQPEAPTVTSLAAVSTVGDQAEFLAANLSQDGMTFYADVIYVIDGQVVFLCDDFHLNTQPDDAAQQTALTQCAQHVVSVL